METQIVSSVGWFSASLLISRGKSMALNISLNWKPLLKGIRIAVRKNMYGTPPPPTPPPPPQNRNCEKCRIPQP